MRRVLLLTVAILTAFSLMAAGRGDGSTKANAIEFDWGKGNVHTGGIKWYRVDLAPLYEEENPSLSLYVTNPSRDLAVEVDMNANVAGETETKHYTIAPHEFQSYTANATMLVRMRQTEIYLTLSTTGEVRLSAKVFEATDLDETCKDAKTLRWNTEMTQTPGYAAWWKVDLNPVKNASRKDAKVTITNTGSQTVNLRAGQSLDCPSSGLTKRSYELAPGAYIIDTIPQSMVTGVQPDELYFSIENLEAPVSIKVELVDQPDEAIISATDPYTVLHVTDTMKLPTGATLYRIKVADMDSVAKYEPEFIYRNESDAPAKVTVKMAFGVPAYGTGNTEYDLAPGQEEVVVYKKNMLASLQEVEYIYLLTIVEGDVHFYGRFKHVREGKACKTNIDFNWETGHRQEARSTQWYAVNVEDVRNNEQDIILHLVNEGNATATVKGSLAFSCPYIDVQEVTRTIAADGNEVTRMIGLSSYAIMTDTIWVGLETDQNIRFWATTQDAPIKDEPDTMCYKAVHFDWEEGVLQHAGDTVWYWINMEEVRERSAKFPTVFIQNLSNTNAVKIDAELSLECPDELENEKRTMTIAANGAYSRKLSRNLFENIVQDEMYLRVVATQDISIQVLLTDKPAGSDCASAVTFNWTSGNRQDANTNLWYTIDVREAIQAKEDVLFTIENGNNTQSDVIWQLAYTCPDSEAPSVQKYSIDPKASCQILKQYAEMRELPDSILYVNLQGTTSLYISAVRLATDPFEPINRKGLKIDTISLNGEAFTTQMTDTVWKVITKEEVIETRELLSRLIMTPQLDFQNTSDEDVVVKIEIAYGFPIKDIMRSITVTVPAGGSLARVLDWKAFKQAVTSYKEIYLRITIPTSAAGKISYKSTMVDPFDGTTRVEAMPFMMNKAYTQDAMTERWYKYNFANLKSDQDLYGKLLEMKTVNIGDAKAEVDLEVYEGLLSDVDMIDYYLGDRGKRTIGKGEKQTRKMQAEYLYGIANMELYVKVRTTEKVVIEWQLSDYDAAAPDPTQQDAKLLVPNVDYILPANTTVWYRMCMPYIQNNYMYVDAGTFEYEVEEGGDVLMDATITFQDTLAYQLPVKTRTFKVNEGETTGQEPVKELINDMIREIGFHFDVSGFEETFLDSIIHRYVTKDSVTAYFRLKTDKKMKMRINLPQTTGLNNDCQNPMNFDWEHGNVNPKDQLTWYRVTLDKRQIPDSCDVRLHVVNWSDTETATGKADMLFKLDDEGVFNCNNQPDMSLTKTVAPNDEEWKDVARNYLESMGWPSSLFIKYESDQATHIWLEMIPQKARVRKDTYVTMYMCDGERFDNPLDHNWTVINASDPSTLQWKDSIEKKDTIEAILYDTVVHYTFIPRKKPTKIYPISQLTNRPVILRGKVLDVSAATAELQAKYNADTVGHPERQYVDTIFWRYSLDGQEYEEIPDEPLYKERINLMYYAALQCENDGDTLENTYKNIARDTLIESACKSYDWNIYNDAGRLIETRTYDKDTKDFVTFRHTYLGDSIYYLELTILPPVEAEDSVKGVCNSFTWTEGDGKTYYTDTTVVYTFVDGAAGGCDSIVTMKIELSNEVDTTLSLVSKFGNRLLMINRLEINNMPGWENALDSLDNGMGYVTWYREASPKDEEVGKGYYYNLPSGDPLPVGDVYYAVLDIPASEGVECGLRGETRHYRIPSQSHAPALMPSLAKPGENIRVINLDPTVETTVRLYTTDGMLQRSFTVSGEDTFVLKAQNEHGFYLVELSNDDLRTTLRYIVK